MKRLHRLSAPLLMGGAAVVLLEVARRIFRVIRLFNPARDPILKWDPEDYGIPRAQTDEVWIESGDGELLYGWYCRAHNPIASALYCHGNTGNLTNTAPVIPHLLESGINVLLFDYRGYGRSSGRPTVRGVVADSLAAARFHDTIRPRNLPSILYGYSLGGAIAAQTIQRHPFDGLILQSTFTSLPEITRVVFPRLPLHHLSGRLFDTRSVLQKLTVPLLIIHGEADQTCPSWMAHALHAACGSASKTVHIVDQGLHKDLWARDAGGLTQAVNRFAVALPRTARELENSTPFHEQLIDAALRLVRRPLRRRPA